MDKERAARNRATQRALMRWPLAWFGIAFFTAAGTFAVVDDDLRMMLNTSVIMGAVCMGAWIYALGRSRYSGESADVDLDVSGNRTAGHRISDTSNGSRDSPGVSLDSPPEPPTISPME